MRIFILSIACAAFLGCSRQYPSPDSGIILYGHGGEGFSNSNAYYAPNSVNSIRRAFDFYELDGVEVDLQFTQDGQMVVYHDSHLESTTQCKGRVTSLTLAETQGCNYRKAFNNSVYEDQVISLDSFITLSNTEWRGKQLSLHVQANFEVPIRIDTLAMIYGEYLDKIENPARLKTECADANFLFFLRKVGDYECLLNASLDSNGYNDVFRFGLQGISAPFDSRNKHIEKRLKDSAKTILLYGQKLSNHYTDYTYEYIDGVQVDNPIKALKFYKGY